MIVVVRLMGGIGSQMLQYSTACRLALKHNGVVRFDLGYLDDKQRTDITIRNFELDYFPVQGQVATADEMRLTEAYKHNWLYRTYNKVLKMAGMKPKFVYLSEGGDFQDRKALLDNAPDADILFLEGYWFNETYFVDVADRIRHDLAFKAFADARNQAVADQIKATCAVSLHVRRGDYLKYPSHGVCPPAYYERAVEHLANTLPVEPTYFVFSDDIAWVRDNMPLPGKPVYIDWNKGADSIEDIHLMSLCQHHIIANSSFSWWGGWLNPRTDKIVICPRLWHADPVVASDRVVPATWVQL